MAFNESFSIPAIGTPVRSATGDEVGTLSDVAFDAGTGDPRFAVIELAADSTQLLVPWDAIGLRTGGRLVLSISDEELRAAPRFRGHGSRSLADMPHGRREPHPAVVVEQPAYGVRVAVGLLVLILLVGIGYLISRQFSPVTSDQMARVTEAVKQTTVVVRQTSADTATTVKVKAALALSKRVPARDVGVETRHAVTTLTGTVQSPETREVAGQIAADTAGVREVRNLLTVESPAAP